eukprot:scaffold1438_cov173-Ochromonas_danica.AAC.14
MVSLMMTENDGIRTLRVEGISPSLPEEGSGKGFRFRLRKRKAIIVVLRGESFSGPTRTPRTPTRLIQSPSS